MSREHRGPYKKYLTNAAAEIPSTTQYSRLKQKKTEKNGTGK